MGMTIIIIGNPVDGLQFIGPFKTSDDAIAWVNCDAHIDADWWVASLEAKDMHERSNGRFSSDAYEGME